MKRIFSTIITLLMFLLSVGYAEDNTDYSAYESIRQEERIELEEALLILDNTPSDEDSMSLVQMMTELAGCEGVYVQDKTDDSRSKVYTATVDIYLKNGTPFCHVDYTNFGGELEEAEIKYDLSGSYLFSTNPIGTFFSRELDFAIQISEDRMKIQWGSSDYSLTRSEGALSEIENPNISFIESDTYQTIVKKVDSLFKNYDHDCVFNDDTHELSIYVAFKNSFRNKIMNGGISSESWESLLEQFKDVTSSLSTVVDLGTRDGLYSIHAGSCSITIVDLLNLTNSYTPNDISCVVRDGVVIYDVLDDSVTRTSSPATPTIVPSTKSQSGVATWGERNALSSAKSYLEIMAFSRTGLIEQLEYEGYTTSEATYAVDHCGADWKEQASKSAKTYLDIMSFSRSGLIEQLEYEGFTHEQAVYGVTMNGY